MGENQKLSWFRDNGINQTKEYIRVRKPSFLGGLIKKNHPGIKIPEINVKSQSRE